ncbi:HVO_0649 family zinc finger protein [Candidatus Halobonum tyrrellensis]|uniref:Small CPxCG-related zinc finger protein n=1 Tax=Candidatus Halobonum tyrrellensis G22 TaxID=1324957 RepID=V4GWY7_9EURY|nr:HVO_0649 family zinc finger protein [Candidatus Halobonum tyrrellensis]ESP89691.1 hypothetical protein K933_02836 [Candidatus Halobonum tyrrellensis G22]
MARSDRAGTTPLDRYRERLREEPECAECGFTDEGGDWRTKYRNRRIVYHHLCPRCGATETLELRLDGE